MASKPLFDYSGVDLTHIAVSPEEVGRMNPQCGAMRQLDHLAVLDFDLGDSLGVKQVGLDEFWVPLHIPGRPLMPGVLMIEAAAQLASVYHHTKAVSLGHDEPSFLGFTRVDQTVFRGQVVPGDTLVLLNKEKTYSYRRFVSRAQGWVGDKLVMETEITGMRM